MIWCDYVIMYINYYCVRCISVKLVSIIYIYSAIVYLSHGIAEYLGRYDEIARLLCDNNMLVIGHDHGKLIN